MRLRPSSETLDVDDDVGDLQPSARSQHTVVSLRRPPPCSGTRSITPLERTTSTDPASTGYRLDQSLVQLDVVEPHLARARACRARASSRSCRCRRRDPAVPTISAAISRSVPAPHPRSSTVWPGSTRPSTQGLATPAKLSTVAFRDARELGPGVAELLRPGAPGREDEVLVLVGGDLGVWSCGSLRAGRRRRRGCRWRSCDDHCHGGLRRGPTSSRPDATRGSRPAGAERSVRRPRSVRTASCA